MYETESEVKLILITTTALILLLAVVVVVALFIQQKRKYQHRQQLLHMQVYYDKEMLKAELKIQGETFRAISQNLHDNIGSNISTAMLLLYKDEIMTTAELESNRTEAIGILDKSVDDLKNIARSLNPDYLNEIGLSEAMRLRLQQLEKTKKYNTHFYSNHIAEKLDAQKQLILFYIFQESITNINTHSGANIITVNLLYEPEKLSLIINDNGKGMKLVGNEIKKDNIGSGLLNMKHHAEIIDGKLSIESEPGKGTEIKLTVINPYQANP